MTPMARIITVHDSAVARVMHRDVSLPGESCTVRYLGQRVMHSEVSWFGESCTVRYPGPESHA